MIQVIISTKALIRVYFITTYVIKTFKKCHEDRKLFAIRSYIAHCTVDICTLGLGKTWDNNCDHSHVIIAEAEIVLSLHPQQ